MALSIRGRPARSVFNLSGDDENAATFAVGWALEQSPQFRAVVIAAIFGQPLPAIDCTIALQKHAATDGGFTDIELQAGTHCHAIVEAKRAWQLPTVAQLTRYLPRLKGSAAAQCRLVTVSAADSAFARRRLPSQLRGIGLVHLSWTDLQRCARRAHAAATGFQEKLWLQQLQEHLRGVVAMDRQSDNQVFVVALGRDAMVQGKTHTWIDVVEKDGCYFHPVGNKWPVQPPNYVGFRYGGCLQSVHHIDSFDVVTDLSKVNRNWPKTSSDHFVYRLGPAMRPAQTVRTGNLYRSGRVWCAIDTLLSGSCATISDARDETQRRIAAAS